MTSPSVTSINGTVTFSLVVGLSSARPSRNVIRELLGPDTYDPVVDLRAAGKRSGSLVMLADSLEIALELEDDHAAGEVMTLTAEGWPNGGMSYVVADGDIQMELDPDTQRVWLVTVPFVEVTP